MAAREAVHALHEGLLRPRGHQQHPHSLDRALGEGMREPEHGCRAGEVVVPPGTTARAPMSAKLAALPAARSAPARSSAAPAQRGSERHRDRAGEHREHDRRRGVAALEQRREVVGDEAGDARVEHEPGVGGVVMGDEDDGVARVGVAGLGDDVPGGPVWEEAAAKPQRTASDVARDPRGREHSGGQPRHRRPRSAANPPSAARPLRSPSGHQYVPWARSSSTLTSRHPAPLSSAASHSAASRSPADADGREMSARCRIAASSRDVSTGISARHASPSVHKERDPDK